MLSQSHFVHSTLTRTLGSSRSCTFIAEDMSPVIQQQDFAQPSNTTSWTVVLPCQDSFGQIFSLSRFCKETCLESNLSLAKQDMLSFPSSVTLAT